MRVLRSDFPRPLDVLAVGAGGHVAAACSTFGVRGDVAVWDVTSGRLVFTHPGGSREVASLAFTPDGGHLFIGGEAAVEVFDARTWRAKAGPDYEVTFPEVAVSPAGDRLLVTGLRGITGRVSCWELGRGREPVVRKLWQDESFDHILFGGPAIGPGGTRAAMSLHYSTGDRSRNAVHLSDLETGESWAEIEFDRDGSDPVKQVGFSGDGTRVLVRGSGRTVKVFDAATGQPAGELVHPGRPYVTGMAIHPGGAVACSRTNGTVCLWDLGTGKLVRTLDWKLGKLVSVAFSPDGSIGAAGTEDGRVVVWDVD